MADEPKPAPQSPLYHLVRAGRYPGLADFSILQRRQADPGDQLQRISPPGRDQGVNDLTIGPDTITGKLLPNGIEELAKERKEPDLPKKLAKHV